MRLTGGMTHRAEQATGPRDWAQAPERGPHTIAVTSGKGGVGKTNLSVNLAIGLAGRGFRATLLDADFGLANADVLLNMHPRLNLSHVLTGDADLPDILLDAPGGIGFVSGASGMGRMANLSTFEQHRLLGVLDELAQHADVLVLDCGAGISRSVTSIAGAADICLVVTTPEPTAMTDAYATIKVLSQERVPPRFGLVVNQCSSKIEAQEIQNRVRQVSEQFLELAVEDFGYILSDEAVGLAVRQRMPLLLRYPRSSAAACVSGIAAQVARQLEAGGKPESLLRRVASLFF